MRTSFPRLLACFAILVLFAGAPAFCAERSIHPWEILELALTAEKELPNAYVDGLPDDGTPYATVTFSGESGPAKGKSLKVRAFWDGGRDWKVRFAPPAPGTWSYAAQSADPGLAGVKGSLNCLPWTSEELNANPTRRGFVRVAGSGPRAGRHFAYADGTPFLWIGDTWWDWSKPGIKFETFQRLVDDRAARGFTVGQLRFYSRGMLDRTRTQPGLDEIRRIEKFVEYANSRGLTVWIMPWWGGEDLMKRTGPEAVRRWWRYTMQRLGACNVLWVLAGEYNMDDYSGLGLPFWRDLAAMIRREDPFGHIISTHPTPPTWDRGMAAPQWSTAEVPAMHAALDYDQSQSGHGRSKNEMIPLIVSAAHDLDPPKPIVVTEPWYEFIEGSAAPEDVRFAAWSAVLSGAAGHSYGGGGVWWAHTPESPSTQSPWPLERSFGVNTWDYPGARAMGVLSQMLRSIEWWRLEPHPELLSETPSKYCAAVPGRELLVYLRWGGSVKVDLRPSSAADQFEYRWIDPATGRQSGKGGVVSGGEKKFFNAPGGYPGKLEIADWLLHIKRR